MGQDQQVDDWKFGETFDSLRTDEPSDYEFGATMALAQSSLEARRAGKEMVRQQTEGLARWTKPGTLPHSVASLVDYAAPAAAEAVADPVLALGSALYRLPAWVIDTGSSVMNKIGGTMPPTNIGTLPVPTFRGTLDWLTDDEYGKRVDAGRAQFEGPTDQSSIMRGTRMLAQEALGLFTSFGGIGYLGKVAGGSKILDKVDQVAGLPGRFVRRVGQAVASPLHTQRYANVLLRVANKAGLTTEQAALAAARGTLARETMAKIPGVGGKLVAWAKIRAPELVGTTAGLGALGALSDELDAETAAGHLMTTALLSPLMVGLGGLANRIAARGGQRPSARVLAGFMEGTGFAAITTSPAEWWEIGRSMMDGEWDKLGDLAVRALGQSIGMAMLRGFSTDGLDAWRRNHPQDRVRDFQELATNRESSERLQTMGWVGTPKDGEVEFRQPGRAATFKLKEGEGGNLIVRMGGKTFEGEAARSVVRALEIRSMAESLIPAVHELPEAWTETTPGVFRDVAKAKEHAFRGRWVERDLKAGANAPWQPMTWEPPLRKPRPLEGELRQDLAEVVRLAETAAREVPEEVKSALRDPLFHVELAEHLTAALIAGPDGGARTEARAFLRASRALPASDALRGTARILAGLSNSQHELARFQQGPMVAAAGAAAEPRASDEIAGRADWRKATRSERRRAAAEFVAARRQEGREATEEELRSTFGLKDRRTRKRVRSLAGENPLGRYGTAAEQPAGGEPAVEPIRGVDVLRGLRGRPDDPVKVPLREAGIATEHRRAGAIGVYYAIPHMARSQVAYDFATGTHEWAHAMERQLGKLGRTIPTELLEEARHVTRYYGDPTGRGLGAAQMRTATLKAEAWAEYWARHLLGDTRLAEEVPNLHRWMQEWAGKQTDAVRAQLNYLQGILGRWQQQGPASRARMQTVTPGEAKSPEQRMAEGHVVVRALRSLERHLWDEAGELRRVEKEMGKGPETRPSVSPYKTRRLFSMNAAAEGERMLTVGTHDVLGRQTGLAPKQLWDAIPVAEHKDMGAFMVATRELEMARKGLVTSASVEELTARVKALKGDKKYNVGGVMMTRAQIARQFNDYFGRVVDYVTGHGMFDQATAAAIKGSFKYYNPFYRQFFEDAPAGAARGEAAAGPAVRRMITGGVREVLDPREAMARWTIRTIAAAHHYAIRKSLVANAAFRDSGSLVFEVPKAMVPHDHPLKQVLELVSKVQKEGGQAEQAQLALEMAEMAPADAAITFWNQAQHPDARRPWFQFTPRWSAEEIADVAARDPAAAAWMRAKNGKEAWWEVDPRVYEYVAGASSGNPGRSAIGASLVGKLGRGAAATVRLGTTGISPVFTLRNLIRDTLTYPLYATRDTSVSDWARSLGPLEGLVVFARSAMELGRNTELAQRYKALGGLMPTLVRTELGQHGLAGNLFGETQSALGKLRAAVGSVVKFLSAPEGVLRFAEFKNVFEKRLREGWSEQDAARDAMLAAKEVTLNFTAAGVTARAMNQYVPYLNAHLQGQRKFWRTALGAEGKRPALRAWSAAIVNMGFMSTAAWLTMKLLGREEEWAALPEDQRNRYWFFANPAGSGFIQIPKPFEFGSLIAHPVEQFLDRFGESHPTDTADWAVTFLGNVFGPFWPPRWAESMPSAIKPTMEVTMNTDFFSRRAIVPEWMAQSREPGQQAHRWNTAASKALGEFLGLSPAKIDHLLGEHTGGLWGSVNRWIEDTSTFIGGGDVSPLKLTGGLSQMAPHAFKSSQVVTDLYDRMGELRQRRANLTGKEKSALRRLERAADKMAAVRNKQETMSKETLDAELHRIANDALSRGGF